MTQTFHDKSFITNNVILSCSNFQDFVLMFWNIKWAAGYFCPGTGKHFHSSVTKSIKSRRNQFTKSTFVWGHAQKFWNISQKRAINRHPFILQSSGWLYRDVPLVSWELITFHSCSDLIKSCHHPGKLLSGNSSWMTETEDEGCRARAAACRCCSLQTFYTESQITKSIQHTNEEDD